jgi:hypothetical protein
MMASTKRLYVGGLLYKVQSEEILSIFEVEGVAVYDFPNTHQQTIR